MPIGAGHCGCHHAHAIEQVPQCDNDVVAATLLGTRARTASNRANALTTRAMRGWHQTRSTRARTAESRLPCAIVARERGRCSCSQIGKTNRRGTLAAAIRFT
jgi:hypothetical protein